MTFLVCHWFQFLILSFCFTGSIDNDDRNAFSQTGALTIKSSSSSSGGLVAAFGISRENSVESNEDGNPLLYRDVQSDPGETIPGEAEKKLGRVSLPSGHSVAPHVKRSMSEERTLPCEGTKSMFGNIKLGGFGPQESELVQQQTGEDGRLSVLATQEQRQVGQCYLHHACKTM